MTEVANAERRRFPWPFVLGTGLVMLVIALALIVGRSKSQEGGSAVGHLPFGAEERAYAQHVHVRDLHLSQATNLLNEEFIYLNGVLANEGIRTLRDVELTVEFRNSMNQVILRAARRVVGPKGAPIQGGERREFQITFESVPASWNREYPAVRVTGLQFE